MIFKERLHKYRWSRHLIPSLCLLGLAHLWFTLTGSQALLLFGALTGLDFLDEVVLPDPWGRHLYSILCEVLLTVVLVYDFFPDWFPPEVRTWLGTPLHEIVNWWASAGLVAFLILGGVFLIEDIKKGY